jgi:hypothetical protein
VSQWIIVFLEIAFTHISLAQERVTESYANDDQNEKPPEFWERPSLLGGPGSPKQNYDTGEDIVLIMI